MGGEKIEKIGPARLSCELKAADDESTIQLPLLRGYQGTKANLPTSASISGILQAEQISNRLLSCATQDLHSAVPSGIHTPFSARKNDRKATRPSAL